jgi:hypothetical protein
MLIVCSEGLKACLAVGVHIMSGQTVSWEAVKSKWLKRGAWKAQQAPPAKSECAELQKNETPFLEVCGTMLVPGILYSLADAWQYFCLSKVSLLHYRSLYSSQLIVCALLSWLLFEIRVDNVKIAALVLVFVGCATNIADWTGDNWDMAETLALVVGQAFMQACASASGEWALRRPCAQAVDESQQKAALYVTSVATAAVLFFLFGSKPLLACWDDGFFAMLACRLLLAHAAGVVLQLPSISARNMAQYVAHGMAVPATIVASHLALGSRFSASAMASSFVTLIAIMLFAWNREGKA